MDIELARIVEKVLDEEIPPFDDSEIISDLSNDDTFGNIPIKTCRACKTTLYVEDSFQTPLAVDVYIDPGSEGTFISQQLVDVITWRIIIYTSQTRSVARKRQERCVESFSKLFNVKTSTCANDMGVIQEIHKG